MKKINISITGALGRMGRILIKKISRNKKLRIINLIVQFIRNQRKKTFMTFAPDSFFPLIFNK